MPNPDKYIEILKNGAKLAGVLDLRDALILIAESAANLTSSQGAALLLFDHLRDELIFFVATGPSGSQILEKRQPANEGIAGKVIKTGKAYITNHATNDSNHSRRMDSKTGFSTNSIMAVPLTLGSKKVGVLETVNKTHGIYLEEDLLILQSFAQIAVAVIENAKKFEDLRNENIGLVAQQKQGKHRLIGKTPQIEKLRQFVQKIAKKPVTVLINGESGTGKEVIAWQIHENSKRVNHPFIKVSCASLNENLLESELFGHEKGSFTGATAQHIGKFERAKGGTLFLDEIGEISEAIQVKLLRVLQENEIERVGGSKTIDVDARIISATNRDLQKAVREGLFREDLYYRLNVVSFVLPPLRERKSDIPLLAKYILKNLDFDHPLKEISDEAMEVLKAHPFPGNVRELENMIERAAVLASDKVLTSDLLPITFIEKQTPTLTLDQIQRKSIIQALIETKGNKSKAAKLLDISRDRFRYRLKTLNIKETDY